MNRPVPHLTPQQERDRIVGLTILCIVIGSGILGVLAQAVGLLG